MRTNVLDELLILQNDIDKISRAGVRLLDINTSNCVNSDGIYLIDFGNYKINDSDNLFCVVDGQAYFIDNATNCLVAIDNVDDVTKVHYTKRWNYSKINALICEMLFMNNLNIIFYMLRKIIEFFREKRQSEKVLFDLEIYKQYFDGDLPVGNAIEKFINENIHLDPKEQAIITDLIGE